MDVKTVIGLDLGNFNSFPSYIEDLDLTKTRLGGRTVDLLPDNDNCGIPSVFFYNPDAKPGVRMLSGRAACSGVAKPVKNRIRYLKRDLGKPLAIDGKPLVIDGRQWMVDDAIREVVQSCIREANGYLKANQGKTTNLVSLAYPASYSCGQRQRLIEIVESATLEDGQHLKVFGTIAEPAAAALDYLASSGQTDRETTVLAYDLGGGTFDLGLVTCYPQGKKSAGGQMVYYDIHKTVGIPNLGGKEFDEIVFDLLYDDLWGKLLASNARSSSTTLEEFEKFVSARNKDELRNKAEELKRDLTVVDRTSYEIYIAKIEEDVTVEITLEDFEKKAKDLLARTVKATKEIVEDFRLPAPERIVLTGGASQMPMVKKALEEALPAYRGKIELFRPGRAISHGAARYGCAEPNTEPQVVQGEKPQPRPVGDEVVIKRAAFDLGVRYFNTLQDEVGFIQTMIPAGTELPYTSAWEQGRTLGESRGATDSVYEARRADPDRSKPDEDYRYIMASRVDFGRVVPPDTLCECRMLLDKNGLLTIQSRENADGRIFDAQTTLEDLT